MKNLGIDDTFIRIANEHREEMTPKRRSPWKMITCTMAGGFLVKYADRLFADPLFTLVVIGALVSLAAITACISQ